MKTETVRFLLLALVLSVVVACTATDTPKETASEAKGAQGESFVRSAEELLELLPDSIRKHSGSYQVEQAIERCFEEKEFMLCVCGNVRGLRVFPFNGKKYVCPN